MKRLELTGKKFGRWLVLGSAPRTYQTMWRCRCTCGTEKSVSGANLVHGKSISCGCFREENRPNLSKNRDFNGEKNPRARKSKALNNGVWVPATSIWYKRAAGVFYSAKKKGVIVGFANVAEMATYIKSIAPLSCPVFGKKFVERGNGFSKWSPSIDKINPKKGYVRGNIQVISIFANCMKRDASKEELRMFANWILKC